MSSFSQQKHARKRFHNIIFPTLHPRHTRIIFSAALKSTVSRSVVALCALGLVSLRHNEQEDNGKAEGDAANTIDNFGCEKKAV